MSLLVAPGVQVDKLCETKGMDYIDREKAKCVNCHPFKPFI